MADEKKTFDKTTKIDWKEFKKLVDDYKSFRLLDINKGKHIVVKLDDKPVIGSYKYGKEDKVTVKFPVTYRFKNDENEIIDVSGLKMQIGESCFARLEKKCKEKEIDYVGKWAICKTTVFEGKNVQFVGVMKNEPTDFKTKDEMFSSGTKPNTAPAYNENVLSEFNNDFIQLITEENETRKVEKVPLMEVSFNQWLGIFFKNTLTKEVKEQFEKYYTENTEHLFKEEKKE